MNRAQRKAALLSAFRRVYAVDVLRYDWEHTQTVSIAVLSSCSCRPCGYRTEIRAAEAPYIGTDQHTADLCLAEHRRLAEVS